MCRYALEVGLRRFYDACNGVSWTIPWNTSRPLCGQPGASCQPGNTTLSLAGNNVSCSVGDVADSLFAIASLTSLDLVNNGLFGTFNRSQLSCPENLTSLDMSQNYIAGRVEDFWPCPALRRLGLADNNLSGAGSSLLNLIPTLEYLFIASNNLSTPMQFLSNMTTSPLRMYIFTDNNYAGTVPSEFAQLRQLQTLRLDMNQFYGSLPADLGLHQPLGALQVPVPYSPPQTTGRAPCL